MSCGGGRSASATLRRLHLSALPRPGHANGTRRPPRALPRQRRLCHVGARRRVQPPQPAAAARRGRPSRGDGRARADREPRRFLSTIQVGITLIGIFSGAFGEATLVAQLALVLADLPVAGPYAREIAIAIVVIGITYGSLILGELVPKRLALYAPEAIATRIALPMQLLSRLMHPFVKAAHALIGVDPATLRRARECEGDRHRGRDRGADARRRRGRRVRARRAPVRLAHPASGHAASRRHHDAAHRHGAPRHRRTDRAQSRDRPC